MLLVMIGPLKGIVELPRENVIVGNYQQFWSSSSIAGFDIMVIVHPKL